MENALTKRLIFPVKNEEGIAMATVLMVMVILLLLAGTTLYTTRIETRVLSNYQSSVQALHAAEAGVERVYDALKLGDTNGDGVVDGLDSANSTNDLDGNGTIDFIQVFRDGVNIGADANRITVNSGNTRAFIWVDASAAPTLISIHSRGNPNGTNSQREVTLAVTTSGQLNVAGAINNST